ncbi:hypothetical protein Patl1_21356 [Pistacia atlantica]|uniref:Uncharacterized protein n=1 Tax=Pistacia atlantica TaxID=434234 RepID=A0ACC1BMI0_9ROSI|nr:hypothetical protein Patl1_21356 [Pistacia atlantica]
MESSSLCSSVLLPSPSPFSSHNSQSQNRKFGQVKVRPTGVQVSAKAGRDSCDSNYRRQGQLVDESMIVLRKRIHEMKMIERNYEPPAEWMAWEKRYYTCYDELICQGVGFLQSYLMNCRPSLALGLVAVVAMSVPASSFLVACRLLELANGVLSATGHVG